MGPIDQQTQKEVIRMVSFLLKRLLFMLLTLWIIITCTFYLIHLLPGTPLSNEERLPPEIRDQILKQYGLDQPLSVQYIQFIKNLLQGDLGKSLSYDGRSITDMLIQRFYASAFIGMQAILFGVLVGTTLGIFAAYKRGSWMDQLTTLIAVLGVSIPHFVFAGILSYWIGVKGKWLPPALWGSYEHTILPSLALSVYVIAQISRFIRTEMIEVLHQNYIKTAMAKGFSRQTAILRHGLRNAMIPGITILGPLTVNILTGSLVVENIFAVPGMGSLFVESIINNDYTLILGVTIFYSLLILMAFLLIDLLYGVIDPRIRLVKTKEGSF